MPSAANRPACDRSHPHRVARRTAIQAGAVSLLGLGTNHLEALRAADSEQTAATPRACIFIFLSGGLAQHDSFDLKPDAADSIRVACGRGAVDVLELQAEGRRRMPADDFLNGYELAAGDHFE